MVQQLLELCNYTINYKTILWSLYFTCIGILGHQFQNLKHRLYYQSRSMAVEGN